MARSSAAERDGRHLHPADRWHLDRAVRKQALAERLALDEVLAQERIPPAMWKSAELAWREALVDAPDLQLELISLRRCAEDCLARPVSPLDDDPEAWMGVMGMLALADGAKCKVEALGLTMCDVARLARSWKRKMEQDLLRSAP